MVLDVDSIIICAGQEPLKVEAPISSRDLDLDALKRHTSGTPEAHQKRTNSEARRVLECVAQHSHTRASLSEHSLCSIALAPH